jgi:hypothetical protein
VCRAPRSEHARSKRCAAARRFAASVPKGVSVHACTQLLLLLVALGFGATEALRYIRIDPPLTFMVAGFVVENLSNHGSSYRMKSKSSATSFM